MTANAARQAAATFASLVVALLAWSLGGMLAEALGLDELGSPVRFGLVFVAAGLAERPLARLGGTPPPHGE